MTMKKGGIHRFLFQHYKKSKLKLVICMLIIILKYFKFDKFSSLIQANTFVNELRFENNIVFHCYDIVQIIN